MKILIKILALCYCFSQNGRKREIVYQRYLAKSNGDRLHTICFSVDSVVGFWLRLTPEIANQKKTVALSAQRKQQRPEERPEGKLILAGLLRERETQLNALFK